MRRRPSVRPLHGAEGPWHGYPGFALVVVVTLGLGIGINTATFSIVNAALIRPLGYADPDRLVALQEQLVGFEFDDSPFSPPDFLDVQRDQQSFTGVAAYLTMSFELAEGGEPVRIDVAKVSSTLFPVLGVQPLLGRAFRDDEDRPGVDVAVLSWPVWQARFGGDPAIVVRCSTAGRPMCGCRWHSRTGSGRCAATSSTRTSSAG